MTHRLLLPVVLASALSLAGCGSDSGRVGGAALESTIDSKTITADQLPAQFDTSRTYHYRTPNLDNPKKMLETLLAAGLDVTRAWQPLDNPICADPVGPTFTVELKADDPAILNYGFDRGSGRLACATSLIEFTVTL